MSHLQSYLLRFGIGTRPWHPPQSHLLRRYLKAYRVYDLYDHVYDMFECIGVVSEVNVETHASLLDGNGVRYLQNFARRVVDMNVLTHSPAMLGLLDASRVYSVHGKPSRSSQD